MLTDIQVNTSRIARLANLATLPASTQGDTVRASCYPFWDYLLESDQ